MYKSRVATSTVNLSCSADKELGQFSLQRLFCPTSRSSFFGRIRAGSGNSRTSKSTPTKESNENAREQKHVRPSSGTTGSNENAREKIHVHPSSGTTGTKTAECPLCLQEFPMEHFPRLRTCPHRSCYECFQTYLRVEISESRVNIACPICAHAMHPNDIRMILNDKKQLEKYETFMIRRVLAAHPNARWCPAPDCSYAVIATGCAKCPMIKCGRPGCGKYFCYHCNALWHPQQTCDEARVHRLSNVQTSSIDGDARPCPRCREPIVKMNDGGCNQMHCAVCGTQFCWLCMSEITELHYLSLSGCTLWGDKPWSRKKKCLWRLGMLLGAPVGILLAGIAAVPAILIGLPACVGWRLYTKHKHYSKCKRKLCVTSGVVASALVSPIIAVLVLVFGVPILILCVYGLLCVSLLDARRSRVGGAA